MRNPPIRNCDDGDRTDADVPLTTLSSSSATLDHCSLKRFCRSSLAGSPPLVAFSRYSTVPRTSCRASFPSGVIATSRRFFLASSSATWSAAISVRPFAILTRFLTQYRSSHNSCCSSSSPCCCAADVTSSRFLRGRKGCLCEARLDEAPVPNLSSEVTTVSRSRWNITIDGIAVRRCNCKRGGVSLLV